MSFALDLLVFGAAWTHVLLAPYTKVEESFNLHAVHDVLMYGIGHGALPNYDHFVFPGAVPRTFIGSVILAWLSKFTILAASYCGVVKSKFDLQIIVRLVLASLNALGLVLLRHAVSRRFGRPTSMLFTFLTCSQFHLPFWMGRTIPNMFALLPVNIAFYFLLDRSSNSLRPTPLRLHSAIAILTFTVIVFRAELAPLLGVLVLQALLSGQTTLFSVLKVGLITSLMSIAATVVTDSYFWDRWPLWPEFEGIYFNIFQGKSAEWGTSPAHTYFAIHLPKLLLSGFPLAALGAALDARVRSLLVAPLVFVAVLSALGHKEWRFVVYVVPLANVAAARALRWMVSRKKGHFFGRILFLGAIGALAMNTIITALFTMASMANYPGGNALAKLNERLATQDHVHVHISNLAAQSGASLFLQIYAPPYPAFVPDPYAHNWTYNKTESLSLQALTSTSGGNPFTHLIVEVAEEGAANSKEVYLKSGAWVVLDTVYGFERWALGGVVQRWLRSNSGVEIGELADWMRQWPLNMQENEKLLIMGRVE